MESRNSLICACRPTPPLTDAVILPATLTIRASNICRSYPIMMLYSIGVDFCRSRATRIQDLSHATKLSKTNIDAPHYLLCSGDTEYEASDRVIFRTIKPRLVS